MSTLGHKSWDSTVEAIRGAPICMCVFSPRYAESERCLEELAFIVDLTTQNPRKLVLPVFYNVKPMHLRRPDVGPFSKGLEKLSKRDQKAALRWRDALEKCAGFFGVELVSNTSDDSEHNSRLQNQLLVDFSGEQTVKVEDVGQEVCSTFPRAYSYEVELLESIDAQQLFCWHAFGSIFSRQGFQQLASKISSACGGLPLVLQTMGSLLKNEKNIYIWEEVLRSLLRHEASEYNDKLFHQLKLSFDSLEAREKDIFLDISCFLVGTDKDLSMEIWESLGWSVRQGL